MQKSYVDSICNGWSAIREVKIDLSSLDEDVRLKGIDSAKILVNQAYELGEKILHNVTGKDPGEQDRAQAIANFIASAKEICKYAKQSATEYVLTISLETGDRYIDRKYLLGTTHEAGEVIWEIKKEHDNIVL